VSRANEPVNGRDEGARDHFMRLYYEKHGCHPVDPIPGLTIREHFAGMMMQGLLANAGVSSKDDYEQCLAKVAIHYADALLAELAKP
jgi:hypothetical protein